ncbi:hypothetical protein HDU97_007446 [Phlyctochytrium planicorne]|nr:hypothetical protein HDU97_007446 [Phlyctochytrium planicorne]
MTERNNNKNKLRASLAAFSDDWEHDDDWEGLSLSPSSFSAVSFPSSAPASNYGGGGGTAASSPCHPPSASASTFSPSSSFFLSSPPMRPTSPPPALPLPQQPFASTLPSANSSSTFMDYFNSSENNSNNNNNNIRGSPEPSDDANNQPPSSPQLSDLVASFSTFAANYASSTASSAYSFVSSLPLPSNIAGINWSALTPVASCFPAAPNFDLNKHQQQQQQPSPPPSPVGERRISMDLPSERKHSFVAVQNVVKTVAAGAGLWKSERERRVGERKKLDLVDEDEEFLGGQEVRRDSGVSELVGVGEKDGAVGTARRRRVSLNED